MRQFTNDVPTPAHKGPVSDLMAMAAVEETAPMADCFTGFFEAYPPHARSMEEWADACASEQAYGPEVFFFDDDEGAEL